jgi:glycosyltransferase involved in cell wall biosynthesis
VKILYVVNNAAFFASHRLPLALEARRRGHEILLVTGEAGSARLEAPAIEQLRALGIRHLVTRFRSGSVSPRHELDGFLAVVRCMRDWQPDLGHCASPKGLLYGGLASRLTRRPALVLAVSGMGSLFTKSGGALRSLLRWAYLRLVRLAYGHPNRRVIVQNGDDRDAIVAAGFAPASAIRLIPGSGVPLGQYLPLPLDGRPNLVVLPARLLRDKGVEEFVAAARAIRAGGSSWRFALVGTADYDNPSSVPRDRVEQWVAEGVIEWWGHRDDMVEVLAQAAIVCLPSYREGMPKALLEAAAAGCAVVTTDAVGCRDAIEPGVTGDLVPVRDAATLAAVLQALIEAPARRLAYGEAGRALAIRKFDLAQVVRATMDIYDELAGGAPARAVHPTT